MLLTGMSEVALLSDEMKVMKRPSRGIVVIVDLSQVELIPA